MTFIQPETLLLIAGVAVLVWGLLDMMADSPNDWTEAERKRRMGDE